MNKTFIVIALWSLSLPSFSQNETEKHADFKAVEIKDKVSFSVDIPKDWVKHQIGMYSHSFVPKIFETGEYITPIVSMHIFQLDSTVEEDEELELKEFSIGEVSIVSPEIFNPDEHISAKIYYNLYDTSGFEFQQFFHFASTSIKTDYYSVSISLSVRTADEFIKSLSVFKNIIKTFTFISEINPQEALITALEKKEGYLLIDENRRLHFINNIDTSNLEDQNILNEAEMKSDYLIIEPQKGLLTENIDNNLLKKAANNSSLINEIKALLPNSYEDEDRGSKVLLKASINVIPDILNYKLPMEIDLFINEKREKNPIVHIPIYDEETKLELIRIF